MARKSCWRLYNSGAINPTTTVQELPSQEHCCLELPHCWPSSNSIIVSCYWVAAFKLCEAKDKQASSRWVSIGSCHYQLQPWSAGDSTLWYTLLQNPHQSVIYRSSGVILAIDVHMFTKYPWLTYCLVMSGFEWYVIYRSSGTFDTSYWCSLNTPGWLTLNGMCCKINISASSSLSPSIPPSIPISLSLPSSLSLSLSLHPSFFSHFSLSPSLPFPSPSLFPSSPFLPLLPCCS